jgi:hypothetical protein
LRFRSALTALALTSTAAAFVWIGCGKDASCEDDLSCPQTGDDGAVPETSTVEASVDATPDVVVIDAPNEADAPADAGIDVVFDAHVEECDASVPKQDKCVLQDGLGVFVAPGQSDSNPGTLEAPVGTLDRAFAIARGTSRGRVYVCGGTYAQTAKLADWSPISVYGGLTCAVTTVDAGADAGDAGTRRSWAWTGASTKFAPSAPGIVLDLERVVGGTETLADLEFVARNAVDPGAPSVAAFVKSCSDVRFDRVTFRAGNAATGARGADGGLALPVATVGNPGAAGNGGAAVSCTCASGPGTSIGGKGGSNGGDGDNGLPNLGGAAPKDGVAGTGGGSCTAGHEGADGAQGAGGQAATAGTPYGSLTFSGWTANGGTTAATNGLLAQGGGGAGGSYTILLNNSGGGGGGCGGCGGESGKAGAPGGSSFALLLHQSPAVLTGCQLVAGNGGAGGAGGNGQSGTPGALGGAGVAAACFGGKGGRGGGGGGGPGGTGGLSVAVGYGGSTAPTLTGSSTVTGAAGGGGAGGTGAGSGNQGQTGKSGTAAGVLNLP